MAMTMTTQRGESHNWGRAAGGRGFCAWARFEWSGLLVSPPARARSSVDGWMEVIMRLPSENFEQKSQIVNQHLCTKTLTNFDSHY